MRASSRTRDLGRGRRRVHGRLNGTYAEADASTRQKGRKEKRVRKEREKDRAVQFSDSFTMREERFFFGGRKREGEKGRKEKRVREGSSSSVQFSSVIHSLMSLCWFILGAIRIERLL